MTDRRDLMLCILTAAFAVSLGVNALLFGAVRYFAAKAVEFGNRAIEEQQSHHKTLDAWREANRVTGQSVKQLTGGK